MRRNDDIELFSMSFLDLISCAMAGVLVLYTIANRDPTLEHSVDSQRTNISITFQDNIVGRICYRVKVINGSTVYEGSNRGDGGRWVFRDNPMTANILFSEKLVSGAKLHIYIEDFDPERSYGSKIDSVKVCIIVHSPGMPFSSPIIAEMNKEDYYAIKPLN